MKRIFILRTALLFIALLSSVQLWAQVTFKAEAPLLVSTTERFQVRFSVNQEPDGDNTLNVPSFEGFQVIAGPAIATGREIQWINGHQTTSYSRTYTYVLIPETAGKHKIDPASISVDGKTYKTKPLLIEVIDESSASANANKSSGAQQQQQQQQQQPAHTTKPKAQSAEESVGRDDIFITLNVSDKSVYKGEAVRVTLMLYTRVGYPEIESFNMPTFNDFWTQELHARGEQSRAEYNGKIYDTYKLTEHIIAPQRTGKITISAAELNVGVPVVTHTNTGSIFHSSRHVNLVRRALRSAPVTINVKEFPANAPASFNGAVGTFSMSSVAPETQMSANSSNEIKITISGSGNLKFVTAPKLSLPESFEIYDTKVVDNVRTSAAGSSGSITYTYPFVARAAGEFVIEPLVFTYFDLASEQYKSLSTERYVITVKDDGSTVVNSADSSRGYAEYGGRMKQLDKDIRFIHTNKLATRTSSIFVLSPAYWLVMVVIIAIFVVAYHLLRKRIRQNRNVVARRMRQADKVAVQRLRLAERSMHEGNRHAFYEEMLRAMWGYISDKFNIPLSNLTKETIREELYRRGVSAADAEQFCQIISRSDEAQYAPSTESDMGEVYADAVSVISKIESIVKR